MDEEVFFSINGIGKILKFRDSVNPLEIRTYHQLVACRHARSTSGKSPQTVTLPAFSPEPFDP